MEQPDFTIFVHRGSITPKVINNIIHCRNVLCLRGVALERLREVDVTHDPALAKKVIEETGCGRSWPLIYAGSVPVGTIDELEGWLQQQSFAAAETSAKSLKIMLETVQQQKILLEMEAGKAAEMNLKEEAAELQSSVAQLQLDLSQIVTRIHQYHQVDPGKPPAVPVPSAEGRTREAAAGDLVVVDAGGANGLELGLVSRTLENIEWLVSAAVSSVWSLGSYFSWQAPNAHQPDTPTTWNVDADDSDNSKPDVKADSDIDIEVIQTNWYWRQQKRLLRFGEKQLKRIHPLSGRLRAVHHYDSISQINVFGKTFLTFCFNDESYPEYYQSSATAQIITIISQRAPSPIPIHYL